MTLAKTTAEKIEFIKNFDPSNKHYAIHNLVMLDMYAKDLCDIVEKLDNKIKNTTHGRPRIMHKIRRLDENVLDGDTVYDIKNDKMYRVEKTGDGGMYNNAISMYTASALIVKGLMLRIPPILHYGSSHIYRSINIDGKNCVVAIKKPKEKREEEFFETIAILVPDLKNYVNISMAAIGNDDRNDRLSSITLNYYKQEESQTHYLSKNIRSSKKFQKHIDKALELYREINDRPDFLKNNPL